MRGGGLLATEPPQKYLLLTKAKRLVFALFLAVHTTTQFCHI
jgi:hypothetical protein